MKIKQKIITVSSVCLVVVGIVGASLSSIILASNDKTNNKESKPYGREKYEYEKISYFFDKQTILDKCYEYKNNQLCVNEENFRSNIHKIIVDAFKKDSRLSNNAEKYKIELNYQIIHDNSIAMDIVWYIPSSNIYKYYDQLQISLST